MLYIYTPKGRELRFFSDLQDLRLHPFSPTFHSLHPNLLSSPPDFWQLRPRLSAILGTKRIPFDLTRAHHLRNLLVAASHVPVASARLSGVAIYRLRTSTHDLSESAFLICSVVSLKLLSLSFFLVQYSWEPMALVCHTCTFSILMTPFPVHVALCLDT